MPLVVKCPTCRKETPWDDNPHRPFCSDRCKTIDLGDWVEERYRIPSEENDLNLLDDDDDETKLQ
jgi:uncharacterized protein